MPHPCRAEHLHLLTVRPFRDCPNCHWLAGMAGAVRWNSETKLGAASHDIVVALRERIGHLDQLVATPGVAWIPHDHWLTGRVLFLTISRPNSVRCASRRAFPTRDLNRITNSR